MKWSKVDCKENPMPYGRAVTLLLEDGTAQGAGVVVRGYRVDLGGRDIYRVTAPESLVNEEVSDAVAWAEPLKNIEELIG